MKIEFIYTFEEKPQKIVSYPFVLPIMESKETLVEYALAGLSDKLKKQLVKISCCVYYENEPNPKLPKWYNECNGKLYFNEGMLSE